MLDKSKKKKKKKRNVPKVHNYVTLRNYFPLPKRYANDYNKY
jgi:hypothetical protein